jgi:MFS family permease
MGGIRLYRGWRVVVGSGLGVGFGSAVFLSTAFPLISAAVAKAYGWSQDDVAKGASAALWLQAIGYPAAGFLIDRFGSRKVAGASILLFALSLAALAGASGGYGRYLSACAAIGLLAAGTNMVGYARAISHWFDARRGLALGLAAAFQALGAIGLPIMTEKLILTAHWQTAALAIAAFEALVCLPLVLWLVEDQPEGARAEAAPASRRDLRLDATFVKLSIAFAVMGFTFYAIVSNIVFILTHAGLESSEIARVQAVSGLSLIVGRVGFGQLLDRWSAPAVGLATLAASAAFCFGLAFAHSHLAAFAATALGGLSIGGESDFLPYMASRFWGRRNVARVFGLFLIAFVLGAGLGPVVLAKISEALGDPRWALIGLGVLQIVPAALFLTLSPYPRREETPQPSTGASAVRRERAP